MKSSHLFRYKILTISIVCFFPELAMAYIGPGAGLSAIGAFFALIVGVIVAIIGFVWYPIKRIMRNWKKSKHDTPKVKTK